MAVNPNNTWSTNVGANCRATFCKPAGLKEIAKGAAIALATLAVVGIVFGALMKAGVASGTTFGTKALASVPNLPLILIGAGSGLLALMLSIASSSCCRAPVAVEAQD